MSHDFDYVIVGGGTAGCVAAAGLIDNTDARVALIEAGAASRGRRVRTPALYPTLWASSRDWGYRTTPQSALRQRRILWPRGRGIGGSSAINAMIFSLGHPLDAAAYPRGYDLEAARERLLKTAPDDWQIPPAIHPASERFLDACKAAGLGDPEADPLRCSRGGRVFRRTVRTGRRFDAYSHYLRPKLGEPRLEILADLTARRIRFRGELACGVEVVNAEGDHFTIAASRGVILCGGVIATPSLLIRSGIGPAEQLRSLGIDAVSVNEHVGRNLQDHLVVPLIYGVDDAKSLPPVDNRESRIRYVENRSGPLASNLAETGLFASLELDRGRLAMPSELERPQLQVHFTPTHYLQYPLAERWTAANTLAVTWLHPSSRGEIHLDAANGELVIEPNYLTDPQERARLAAAVEAVDAFAQSFGREGGWGERLMPRPRVGRRDWADAAIESLAMSIYHPVGTCRMASREGDGVVDEGFRVRGVGRLYVADAAAMPELPTGNPQGTVMANAAEAARTIAAER